MRAERLFRVLATVMCLLLPALASTAHAATILVYHAFGGASSMSISLASFEAQLDYLERSGRKVVSLEDLARCVDAGKSPPEGAVVIAIDDGWASVMKAYEALKRRNLPFTVFLPMAYVANPGCHTTLSQADIDTLKAYPKVTFANHSFSHSPRLARDEAFAREDVRKSVERFRQVVGHDTTFFAYPYGSTGEAYTRALREAGFTHLFVTGWQPVTAVTSPRAIPRIAAHRLSLPMLAAVLRDQDSLLAKVSAPPATGPLLSATPSAEIIPRNVE